MAQGKEKQVKDPNIGSKRQLALLFAEGEESTARKRKCMDVDRSVNEEAKLSAVAAMQHRQEP